MSKEQIIMCENILIIMNIENSLEINLIYK